ncbi:hypothetical protein JCM10049v2_003269 [Rhodotorula toruloides]
MSDTPSAPAFTSGVASRFVSSNALEEAKKRREAEWREAYARIGQEPPKQEEEEKYDPRSLFERLQENKTKKQEAFEEQLKFKNHFRALDEDEISFLDSMVEDGNEEEKERKKQIEEELRSFRQAVTKRSTAPTPPAIAASLSPSLSPSLASTTAATSTSTPAAPTSKPLAPPVPKKTGAAGKKKSLPGVVVAKKKKAARAPAATKPKVGDVAAEGEEGAKEVVAGEKRQAEREERQEEKDGDEDGAKRRKLDADSAASSLAPKRMPRHMAPRRLAIVGLGNYTHPLTRHSIGQILLQNLAKRAAADPLFKSGSSTLKSARHGMRHAWVAEMVLHPRPDSEDNKPLELRFIVPKSPMNLTGRTALGFFWQWLPTIARSQPKPGSPEALALAEKGEQWWDAVEVDKEVNIAAEERRLAKEEAEQPKRVKSMYRLLTLQDNLDLSPSKYLYQRGGGSKGHNGLRNVIEKYQTERFHRIWVGIGRPERREDVAEWVLGPLTRDEVEACEYDEETKHEGEVLAKAYKEMMRIGYDEPA